MPERSWVHLLTLAGGRVAVWQSPTRRYFTGPPPDAAECSFARYREMHPHGWSRLAEAIRAAAEHEAAWRSPATIGAPLKLVRSVLWETQPTASYQHAKPRVQFALNAALTSLNPNRAVAQKAGTHGQW